MSSRQSVARMVLVCVMLALIIIASGALSASPFTQSSGTYYVSPTGSSANTGLSTGSPWSLAHAISNAPTSATIRMMGGTYRQGDFTITRTLNFINHDATPVLMRGSIVIPNVEWNADGSRWRRDNWTASFPPPGSEGSEYIIPAYPLANYRDQVYINGVSQIQVSSLGAVTAGTFYVNYGADDLYIGSNPIGNTVEGTIRNVGFTIDGINSSVRGVNFAHFADAGVYVTDQNVTFENNVFSWNGVQGIRFNGDAGNVTGGVVRNNTFTYNGRKGMSGTYAHNMLLEGNTLSFNNVENFNPEYDAAGIKVTWSDGVVWRDNVADGNDGHGFSLDIGADNPDIYRNTVRNNTFHGIFFEISQGADIVGNVVHDNIDSGIRIGNSSNVRIINNTLVNNGTHLRIFENERYPQPWEVGATFVTENVRVRNNLVWNNQPADNNRQVVLTMWNYTQCASITPMIVEWDYNGWYRWNSSQLDYLAKWQGATPNCDDLIRTITALRTVTGYDQNGLERIQTTDPFFVSEPSNNYALQTCSPAINAGSPLDSALAAMLNVPANVITDIGALQTTATCSGTATPTLTPTRTNTPIVPTSTPSGVNLIGASRTSMSLTEGGVSVTFNVFLTQSPAAGELVTVIPVIPAPFGSQVTFTPVERKLDTGNWQVGRTFTFTAVNDTVGEATLNFNLSFSSTSNFGVSPFNGAVGGNIATTIIDNDGAPVATNTFTNTPTRTNTPTNTVPGPTNTPTNTSSGPTNTPTRTNTPTNTSVPPTATNTSAGLVRIGASRTSMTLTEGGVSVIYNVFLTQAPAANEQVTVTLVIPAPYGGQVSYTPIERKLDLGNWQVGRNFTINAVDDATGEATLNFVISHRGASNIGGSQFNNSVGGNINVTLNDNDAGAPTATNTQQPTNTPTNTLLGPTNTATPITPTSTPTNTTIAPTATNTSIPPTATNTSSVSVFITTTITSMNISEGGATVTYNVRLSASPAAGELVTISPVYDASELSFNPVERKLDSTNWQFGRNFVVTAVNDSEVEGFMNLMISHTATSYAGSPFNGLSGGNINVNLSDND